MTRKPSGLETKLNDLFVNNAPKLPDGGKKALVMWAPILAVIAGILSLLAAWNLWHWAHIADAALNYANAVCKNLAVYGSYGCGAQATHFSLWLWLGILFLAVEGFLYLLAYSGLKAHKKDGWNYLFYALVLNVVYAVISLFDAYDVAGNFLGTLLASALGFYLLFQIRDFYLGSSDHQPPKATPKDS